MGTRACDRWLVFVLASILFFLSQFYRSANAVIASQLLRDLHLDTAQLGTLSAAFFYAFALTQIPISILIDKIGAKRIMTLLSLAGLIGAFVFPMSSDMTWGLISRILLGIGMACNMIGTLKLLTVWFSPQRFATLTGVVFAIGYVGNMAATTPLAFLVQKTGWRPVFEFIALFYLMAVIAFQLGIKEKDGPDPIRPDASSASPGRSLFSGIWHLFQQKDYWIISLATAVSYGIFAALQTLWAGPFLMEVLHLPTITAGNLIFLLTLGLVLGGPSWGFLSDQVFKSRKWIVVAGQSCLLLIFVWLLFLPAYASLITLILLFIFLGICRSSGMLMYAHIKELMPANMAGTAMTGINFFTMIGPAFLLQGIGLLMQALYPQNSRGPEAFRAAFLLCAICLLVVILLYGFTKDTRGVSRAKPAQPPD
jgi:MFS family permease